MTNGFDDNRYARSLLEFNPIPISYINPDGTFFYVNKEFCNLTGYSSYELLGKKAYDITHPEDLEPNKQMIQELINNKSKLSYSMIKRYINKKNYVVWIHLHVHTINDTSGDPIHFILFAVPLPNHGKFKVEEDQENNLIVRPSLSVLDFIKDNWKFFIGLTISLLPIITAGLVFIWKFSFIFKQIMTATGISWE